MYRIEFEPGDVGVFRSVEEIATAIKSGMITTRARIYHQASDKWLPIEFHPHYKQALEIVAGGGKSTGSPAASTSGPVVTFATPSGPRPAAQLAPAPEPVVERRARAGRRAAARAGRRAAARSRSPGTAEPVVERKPSRAGTRAGAARRARARGRRRSTSRSRTGCRGRSPATRPSQKQRSSRSRRPSARRPKRGAGTRVDLEPAPFAELISFGSTRRV